MSNEGARPDGGIAPGTLFVISAPSGAGKTSLVRELVRQAPHIEVSISHTTRARRHGEVEGVDYHYVSREAFSAMAGAGGFLEHAELWGNCYGTSEAWVQSRLRAGIDIVLEIDWQGAQQVRGKLSCVSVFIMPPSRAALSARLRGRAQDDEQVIATRLADAVKEMSHYAEYDYLLINDDFAAASREMLSIVSAERLATGRQSQRHSALLAGLLSGECGNR